MPIGPARRPDRFPSWGLSPSSDKGTRVRFSRACLTRHVPPSGFLTPSTVFSPRTSRSRGPLPLLGFRRQAPPGSFVTGTLPHRCCESVIHRSPPSSSEEQEAERSGRSRRRDFAASRFHREDPKVPAASPTTPNASGLKLGVHRPKPPRRPSVPSPPAPPKRSIRGGASGRPSPRTPASAAPKSPFDGFEVYLHPRDASGASW